MNKGRLEAFTDAIIAIAATIMVLELKIPKTPDFKGLLTDAPIFLAYVNSFLMIYIAWYMHHDLFKHAKNIKARTFLINGIWVLTVTFFPFITAWVGSAPKQAAPEFLYALNLFLCMITFNLLRIQILSDNPEMKKQQKKHWKQLIPVFLCVGTLIATVFYPPITLIVTGISAIVVLLFIFLDKKD